MCQPLCVCACLCLILRLILICNLKVLLKTVHLLFPDFAFMWLVEEAKKNMPLELDFINEGHNAERVAKMLAHFPFLKVKCDFFPTWLSFVMTMALTVGFDFDPVGSMCVLILINSWLKFEMGSFNLRPKHLQLYSVQLIEVRRFHCVCDSLPLCCLSALPKF